MRSQLLLLWLQLVVLGTRAQQCTQSALPTVIQPAGGDTPPQADGVWYIYRLMGRPLATNPRIQFNTVGQIVEPISGLTAVLQWRATALQPNANNSACQNQFWTGMCLNHGEEIGDEGMSDDSYIMRPTHYTVLHHDYQNLMIHYSCARSGTNGLCASPRIFAETRKRPDQLSASELAAFDATINSIFSKYCVTVDNIPKNTFKDSAPFCPFVDPPFCIAQDIQGMKNSVNIGSAGSQSSVAGSGASYSASPATPSGCKWPVSIPPPSNIDPNVLAGTSYVWRRVFAPEESPVNQIVLFTNIGPSAMPLSNITGRTYTVQYANYASLTSTECVNGFLVFIQGSNGQLTGLIIPYTTAGAPQPIRLTVLRADSSSILSYGCEAASSQTGQCDKPTIVHMVRTNPVEMSQADKDAADALENSFFSKFGCSAKDVQLIPHTKDKPLCPFVNPPECMQKHISGYLQTLDPTDSGPKY